MWKGIATLLVLLATPLPGWGTPVMVTGPSVISGPSPLPHDACLHSPSFDGYDRTIRVDAEGEPDLATNPADPGNAIAAWLQDDGAGIVVASTQDGGATWNHSISQGRTVCTGSDRYDFTQDLDISIGADGIAYLISMLNEDISQDPSNDAVGSDLLNAPIAVATSADEGATWSDPTIISAPWERDTFKADFPRVTADPVRPGHAYASWLTFFPLPCGCTVYSWSRTSDGGATWSPSRPLVLPPAGRLALGFDGIKVLPDGSLLLVYVDGLAQPGLLTGVFVGGMNLLAVRSTDAGASWSEPVPVATFDQFDRLLYKLAAGPNGETFVGWPLGNSFVLARSDDGGRTWGEPFTAFTTTQPIIDPQMAVAADGTLGVAFYDERDDVSGDEERTTDVWQRHSHDGGASWEETRLAGPFDLNVSPGTAGARYPLGEFFGFAAMPGGFASAFVQTAPTATSGATDIFYTRTTVAGPMAASHGLFHP